MPHRYFTAEVGNGRAALNGTDAHHLADVMRAKIGENEKFSAMKSAALSKSAQKRPVIMQFSHKIIFNLPGNHSSICDFPVSLFQHDPVCTKGTH